MLYAKNEFGEHIGPTPGARAYCTTCEATVIARCGTQRIEHWAHKANTSCAAITEPESEWKHAWRQIFKQENCEKTLDGEFFDAIGNNDQPIMLRVTAMDKDKLSVIQNKFPKMICIFDAWKMWGNLKLINRGNYHTFRWFFPQKKIAYTNKLFLHFPCGRLFEMKTLHIDGICGGSGKFWSWDQFYNNYLSEVIKPEYATVSQPIQLTNREDIDFSKIKVHSSDKLDWSADPGKPYINCDCVEKERFSNCITLKRIKDYRTL